MNVDIDTLRTITELGHEGAERAAARLTGLTGIDTYVEVTKVDIATVDDLGEHDDRVGVEVAFDGALAGRSVLSFGSGSTDAVVGLIAGDATEPMAESAVCEVGNITASGFIDAFADHLGASIDISPPTYAPSVDRESLVGDLPGDDAAVLVFNSRITAVDGEIDFRFYMLPDPDSVTSVLSPESPDRAVDLAKLAGFKRMARRGALTVSENVSTMTGVETTVDVTRLAFVPIERAPAEIDEGPQVGVVFEFTGRPSGFLLLVFDEASASAVADALVPGSADEFTEMRKSAIREIANVTASGFVDGWANALGTAIDISTPQFVHDMGRAIVDQVVVRLGQHQESVFMFDATVTAKSRAFDLRIYAMPDERELQKALSDLDTDDVDATDASPGEIRWT